MHSEYVLNKVQERIAHIKEELRLYEAVKDIDSIQEIIDHVDMPHIAMIYEMYRDLYKEGADDHE